MLLVILSSQLSIILAAIRGSISSTVKTVNSETTIEVDLDRWGSSSFLQADSYIEIKFNREHYETYFDSFGII